MHWSQMRVARPWTHCSPLPGPPVGLAWELPLLRGHQGYPGEDRGMSMKKYARNKVDADQARGFISCQHYSSIYPLIQHLQKLKHTCIKEHTYTTSANPKDLETMTLKENVIKNNSFSPMSNVLYMIKKQKIPQYSQISI